MLRGSGRTRANGPVRLWALLRLRRGAGARALPDVLLRALRLRLRTCGPRADGRSCVLAAALLLACARHSPEPSDAAPADAAMVDGSQPAAADSAARHDAND